MANARFNVSCPSCEADVPVTSTATVGKKIECPKCKYRFTCPPAPADGADADKADTPAESKKKKKDGKKGGSTLLVGAGLGVLAVAVLIGGAIFVLDGGEEPKPVVKNTTPTVPQPQPGETPGGGEPMPPEPGMPPKDGETEPKTPGDLMNPPAGAGPKEPPKPKGPDRPPPGPRTAETNKKSTRTTPLHEVTNLLPNDAVAVYQVNMAPAVKTPLYATFFDETIRDLFKESFFFRSELLTHVVFALSGPDREPFAVLRLDAPIDDRVMLDLMGSENVGVPKNSPIRDKYFYTLKSNPFVKAVAGTFTPDSVLGQFGVRLPAAPTPAAAADKSVAMHVYDDQTVILAGEAAMERFLTDLQPNGLPVLKTDLPPEPPKPPPPPPTNPDGSAVEGQPTPPAAPQPTAAPADPNAPVKRFTSLRNYQTIDPELKRLLNEFEPANGVDPPVAVYAELLDQRLLAARGVPALIGKEIPYAAGTAEQVKMVGAVLNEYGRDRLTGKVVLEFPTDDAAKTAAHQHILPSLYLGTTYLGYSMNAPAYTVNEVTEPPPPMAVGFAPMQPQPGSLPPTVWPLGVMPSGGGVPAPGDPNAGFPGIPQPGAFGGEGRGEGIPQPGFPQPGVPVDPNAPMPPTGGPPLQPVLTVSSADRAVNVAVALTWPEAWYANTLSSIVNRSAAQFRGKMVVLSGTTNWDTLARGVEKRVSRKEPFPRGTLERDPVAERFRVAFPPEQRTSFMAELLPYIGQGALRARIQDRKFSWYAKENLPAAEAWVAEFLIPSYPPSSWRVSHPKAPGKFLGATNFVAPAGVGVDAARYNPADPEQARKVGITGYDWGSKAEQVTDGLSNTVYLVQSPPTLPRPWIAGGGATVVGVDDTDAALTPFVATTGAGQRGVHVLMADGSVRFLKEGTDPKVFKALVTRAGNDPVPDLDGVAPVVKPGRTELRMVNPTAANVP